LRLNVTQGENGSQLLCVMIEQCSA